METCVEHLSAHVDGGYSKWLVVLTDTVDFQCVNEKNQFDKESPARAEAAVARVIGQMSAMVGLNLVLLDASGIANFDAKHKLWPTWRRLSQKLTDEVGEHNSGLNIQAADTDEIDEAFERVAGAMASAGASG